MPTRMIRNWTSSEKVDKLSSGAEVFFTRLIMTVDDFGRFHANPKLLKSALFPLREVSVWKITDWLNECSIDLINTYNVDGKDYLEIIDFNQRLRLKNSKFPEMTDKCLTKDGQVSDKCPPETEVEARSRSENRETELSEKTKRFIPPSLKEVQDYCLERRNSVDPDLWMDHYISNDWKVGKNKMKDWRAAVRKWEKSNYQNNSNGKSESNSHQDKRDDFTREILFGSVGEDSSELSGNNGFEETDHEVVQ